MYPCEAMYSLSKSGYYGSCCCVEIDIAIQYILPHPSNFAIVINAKLGL